jgi:hypothetical protein
MGCWPNNWDEGFFATTDADIINAGKKHSPNLNMK